MKDKRIKLALLFFFHSVHRLQSFALCQNLFTVSFSGFVLNLYIFTFKKKIKKKKKEDWFYINFSVHIPLQNITWNFILLTPFLVWKSGLDTWFCFHLILIFLSNVILRCLFQNGETYLVFDACSSETNSQSISLGWLFPSWKHTRCIALCHDSETMQLYSSKHGAFTNLISLWRFYDIFCIVGYILNTVFLCSNFIFPENCYSAFYGTISKADMQRDRVSSFKNFEI